MKIIKYITIKELGSLLNLSESVIRIHLSCFESYRKPNSLPAAYLYNQNFLHELKNFYIQKSRSIGKKYKRYNKTVERINHLINLLSN